MLRQRILSTSIPGVKAKAFITYVKKGKNAGKFYAHGYLIHADSGLRVDRIPEKNLSYRDSFAEAKADLNHLVGRLIKEYAEKYGPSATTSATPFTDAYNSIVDKSILEMGVRWSHEEGSTSERIHKYFMRQVLPRLDRYGLEIKPSDVSSIKAELIDKAVKTKRGNQSLEAAISSVSRNLRDANIILSNLRIFAPTHALPPVEFEIENVRPQTLHHEQIKSLSPALRITMAYTMHICEDSYRGLVLGTAMMFYGGLRTAEAALPCFSDILIHSDRFATYHVKGQLTGSGGIKPPKSADSYRTIVLPYAFVLLIEAQKTYLQRLGYSLEKIAKMPLVSVPGDPAKFAGASAISGFTKQLMECCGFKETKALQQAMKHHPLYDADGTPIGDPRAYILRHDYCSRLINICGLDHNMVDYLMGHKNPHNRVARDSMNADTLSKLAEAMERFVPMPELSLHPAFSPVGIAISQRKPSAVPDYSSFTFRADCAEGEEIRLQMPLTCAEPQDSLVITSTSSSLKVISKSPDSLEYPLPILGTPYDKDIYDKCRTRAIDIQKGDTISDGEEKD